MKFKYNYDVDILVSGMIVASINTNADDKEQAIKFAKTKITTQAKRKYDKSKV